MVDDEDVVRSVAVAALRRMGFDTLEAKDGQEALQVTETHRDRIRLILLDLTMPRMDGLPAKALPVPASGGRDPGGPEGNGNRL